MPVVTISRQLGSGGSDVALAVAERLGVPYLDRELVTRAAARAGLTPGTLEAADERRGEVVDRVSNLLASEGLSGDLRTLVDDLADAPFLASSSYYRFIEEVIREVADKGSAVIVGRGGQVILRDRADAFHVHIWAPMEQRLDRFTRDAELPAAEARRRLVETDANSSGYVRTHYGVEWQDPRLYDLVINTAKVGVEGAVEEVMAGLRVFQGAAATKRSLAYERLVNDRFSVDEIAELFGIGRDAVRHAVYEGQLKAVMAQKHILYVQRRDLLDWLARRA